MADDDVINPLSTPTANYGWAKPAVGGDQDAWGGMINTDLDGIDTTVHGLATNFSATAPAMDGTAAPGSAATFAHSDHVHPTDTSKLSLSGGTMTGTLNGTVVNATGNFASPYLLINRAGAAPDGAIASQQNGSNRWRMTMVGPAAGETGSNAGSDFSLGCYADDGATAIMTPLSIKRSNGLMTCNASINVAGNVSTVNAGGHFINGVSGQQLPFGGFISGANRWTILPGDGVAEAAGDVGSNFACGFFSNAGAFKGNWLTVSRASGVATFAYPIVNGSDRSLKTAVEPIAGALETVKKLQGVSYAMKADAGGKRHVGLIAQDVEPHLPEVVFESGQPFGPEGRAIEDAAPLLGVAYGNVVAVLIEAVKTLAARVEALEQPGARQGQPADARQRNAT